MATIPFAFTAGFVLLSAFSGTSLAAASGKVNFAREIRPILSNNCFHCHGPDDKNRKGNGDRGLRLDTKEGAFEDLGGSFAVVAGRPEKSAILERILSHDADEVMPPRKTGKKLTEGEISLLRRWIQEGAQYAGHWAYSKPLKTEPPASSNPVWNTNAIDRFLFARLQSEKLKPAPEADRAVLARRVMLDLTGLPPTPQEVAAFQNDPRPDAYSHLLDKTLAKPAFGEHWARLWMDLARYADSAGYPSDPGRSIWAFRDYVIRAFNSNKPFDEFTLEQLAGDLLPEPTEEQLMATAFHRNTMTNNEGGTSDEEFRNAAVIDRVNTTWSVWMGTSMACAQCHTHKFDPLTQKEYFSFYAMLNQSEDADRNDEAPLHQFLLPEEKAAKRRLEEKLAGLEARFKKPSGEWTKGFAAWDAAFPREIPWRGGAPLSTVSEREGAVRVREDGSVLVAAAEKGGDNYTVSLGLEAGSLSALKLASVPDKALPGGGASYGANGAFVVDALRATLIPGGVKGKAARFVRVQLTGATRPLQVAELEVFSGGKNVAQGRTVSSSDVEGEAVAVRAVDGRDSGTGTALVTRGEKAEEFFEVDLGSVQQVEKIRLKVPTEGGYYIGSFKMLLLDQNQKQVWTQAEGDLREPLREFAPSDGREVRFKAAYASLASGGFEAQTVVGLKAKNDGNARNKGWNAVAGAKPQTLTLVLEKPLDVKAGDVLRVEIDQRTRKKEQQLASFSLQTSGDARVEIAASIPIALQPALQLSPDKRPPAQTAQLQDYYVRNHAPEAASERTELAAVRKGIDDLKPNTVPVMRELPPDKLRTTKVQIRGNYLNLGDEVAPGTPAVLPPLPPGVKADRLAMARWLVDAENPLTARVIANRFWESIFGFGIVRTSEEFGAQGEMPVHPELLDWLAVELVRSGWDMKAFLKTLLNTAAYRQSSVVDPALQEKDPDNRLLARGPRFRASAEVLRDQALAVSGLLSEKMYGKPVRPPKPSMGLSTAFGRANDWETSSGEDRYRRSLYTEVRRNSPYPSFTTFDAPNREVCTLRRGRTNTPLQALVTLNDPVFVEAAQAFARRLLREAGSSREDRIRMAYQLVLSRPPSARELERLGRMLDESTKGFTADPARALSMATDPAGPLPPGVDAVELASWTTFANVVLNLDEALMRR